MTSNMERSGHDFDHGENNRCGHDFDHGENNPEQEMYAIVEFCLQRERSIRRRFQSIHVDPPKEEDRKARVMNLPAAPWDSTTRIVPMRKYSKGHAMKNKSTVWNTKMKSENFQHWQARQACSRAAFARSERWIALAATASMSRLHQKMKKINEEQRALKEDHDFANVFRQEIQDAEWVRDAGLQIQRSWRRMTRSLNLGDMPLPTDFATISPSTKMQERFESGGGVLGVLLKNTTSCNSKGKSYSTGKHGHESCNGVGIGQLEQDTSLKTRVVHEIVEALGIGSDARAFDERASDNLLTVSDNTKRRHSQADEGRSVRIDAKDVRELKHAIKELRDIVKNRDRVKSTQEGDVGEAGVDEQRARCFVSNSRMRLRGAGAIRGVGILGPIHHVSDSSTSEEGWERGKQNGEARAQLRGRRAALTHTEKHSPRNVGGDNFSGQAIETEIHERLEGRRGHSGHSGEGSLHGPRTFFGKDTRVEKGNEERGIVNGAVSNRFRVDSRLTLVDVEGRRRDKEVEERREGREAEERIDGRRGRLYNAAPRAGEAVEKSDADDIVFEDDLVDESDARDLIDILELTASLRIAAQHKVLNSLPPSPFAASFVCAAASAGGLSSLQLNKPANPSPQDAASAASGTNTALPHSPPQPGVSGASGTRSMGNLPCHPRFPLTRLESDACLLKLGPDRCKRHEVPSTRGGADQGQGGLNAGESLVRSEVGCKSSEEEAVSPAMTWFRERSRQRKQREFLHTSSHLFSPTNHRQNLSGTHSNKLIGSTDVNFDLPSRPSQTETGGAEILLGQEKETNRKNLNGKCKLQTEIDVYNAPRKFVVFRKSSMGNECYSKIGHGFSEPDELSTSSAFFSDNSDIHAELKKRNELEKQAANEDRSSGLSSTTSCGGERPLRGSRRTNRQKRPPICQRSDGEAIERIRCRSVGKGMNKKEESGGWVQTLGADTRARIYERTRGRADERCSASRKPSSPLQPNMVHTGTLGTPGYDRVETDEDVSAESNGDRVGILDGTRAVRGVPAGDSDGDRSGGADGKIGDDLVVYNDIHDLSAEVLGSIEENNRCSPKSGGAVHDRWSPPSLYSRSPHSEGWNRRHVDELLSPTLLQSPKAWSNRDDATTFLPHRYSPSPGPRSWLRSPSPQPGASRQARRLRVSQHCITTNMS